MAAPVHFEVLATRAEYRPVGSLTLSEAVGLVADAISHARWLSIRRLLVVGLGAHLHELPTDMERVFMGQAWARAASGSALRIAFVFRREWIHPRKIGVLVAANRGMLGDVFNNETEALAWLEVETPTAHRTSLELPRT